MKPNYVFKTIKAKISYINFENKLLDESWKFLNPAGDELIVKELLSDFIMIVLDKSVEMKQRLLDIERLKECIEQKNNSRISSEWGCPKIINEYDKLGETKKVNVFSRKKERIEVDSKKQFDKDFAFKPIINEMSKVMQSEDGDANRFESLYRNYQEKEVKILCSKLTALEEELNQCSFAPKILNHQYEPKNYNREKSLDKKPSIQSHIEKELEECTFKPKISSEPIKSVPEKPRGFDEFINKSRQIIQDKLEQKEKEKLSCGENYEKLKLLKSNPPSFLDRQKESRSVLIYIDVNVALGKKGKLALREGDDPKEVAENFCKVYSLGKDYQDNLEEALTTQLNDLHKGSN